MPPTGLPPAQSSAASLRTLDDAIVESHSHDLDHGIDRDHDIAHPSNHADDTNIGSTPPRTSRFTYRQLADLAAAAPTCPLRVIAHIDLDAYYAQCEMRRLGTPDETPLVVQQWRNIIAVNYPARAFGINRMISAAEAKRLCPDLVVQHVPTWKEGESQWAYHADAYSAMAQHKVSLEPYRIRSREILATIKESLPGIGAQACKIEKAGIDEVFVDLSAYIHDLLVRKLYPDVLAGYRDHHHDQPTTALPLPPLTEADLDWAATGSDVIDDQEGEGDKHAEGDEDSGVLECSKDKKDKDQQTIDWDDVAMLEGDRVVRAVRQALYDKLRFRCSAGIASNKMLSKLGSSQHKPNRQTVVRPRAVVTFLESLSSVTKLRGLGGKMGARVVAAFDTESIAELRTVNLAQMQAKLDDQEMGFYIYGMVRGIDSSDVTARTEIKSIISAKSFQPPLKTMDQALRWLRVFAAELKCRLLDEKLSLALLAAATVNAAENNDTETKDALDGGDETAHPSTHQQQQHQQLRLPQTIRLHYGGGSGSGHHWRSRQTRIPRDGSPLDEEKLIRLGTQLLEQTQRTDSLWPCAHLAISVDGFEEPAKGNKSIESFFQKSTATTVTTTKATLSKVIEDGVSGDDDDNDFDDNNLDSIRDAGDDDYDNIRDMPLTKRRRTEVSETAGERGVRNMENTLSEEEGHTKNRQEGAELAKAVDERLRATSGSRRKTAANASTFFKPKNDSSSDNKPDALNIGHGNAKGTANTSSGLLPCSRCSKSFPAAVQLQEHEDWHVARTLQAQEKIALASSSSSGPLAGPTAATASATTTSASLPMSGMPTTATTTTAITATATTTTRRRGHVPVKRAAPTPPPTSISSFFQTRARSPTKNEVPREGQKEAKRANEDEDKDSGRSRHNIDSNTNKDNNSGTAAARSLACSRCGAAFGHPDGLQVHEDWHFAKDLETG